MTLNSQLLSKLNQRPTGVQDADFTVASALISSQEKDKGVGLNVGFIVVGKSWVIFF